MTKQTINIGTSVNKGDGDPLRTAFTKINENFTELYNSIGGLDLSNITESIIPSIDNTYDLGSPTRHWRHVYTAGGSIYLDDVKLTNVGGKLVATKVINPGEDNEAEDPEDSDAGSEIGGGSTGNFTFKADRITNDDDASIVVGGGSPIENIVVHAVDQLVPPGGVWRMFFLDTDYLDLGTIVEVGDTVTTSWGTPITAAITDIVQDIGVGTWALHFDQNITAGFNAGPKTVTFNRGPEVLLIPTSKTWTFNTNGVITLPNSMTIDASLGFGDVTIGGDKTRISIDNGGAPPGFTITTSYEENVDPKDWRFDPDGNLTLPVGGDILDSNGDSVLGGAAGPTQPYLELTDTPFITQPVTLGTPVTAIADLRGQDALVEVVIGEGPVIESITVTTPGVLYVVGQRYRINYWQVGGNSDNGNIDFEVATVGAGGALLTIANAAFAGPAQVNTGTYSGVNIEYRPTEFDEVDTGLTLTRGLYGGLFNAEEEFSYSSSVSPAGTLWNADGWGTLVGFNTRTYDTFNSILTGPDNTPPGELIMWDTINDKYYKFAINIWGVDNNEFSYTRTLITDPNYFKKDDYATANDVDVIEDDSTLQIGITRGLNGGIYNPFTEEDWNSNVSPDGTLWNTDGWNDLTDVETRTYTNFYAAYDEQLGNLVPGSQAVMYVPSIDKYYAIGWVGWTQGIGGNTQGGGFSYTRREIDLTKLDQGVRFADGTVQTTAYTGTNVVSTAPRDRRIETASGYKEVSVTERTTAAAVTSTAAQGNEFALGFVTIVVSSPQQTALNAIVNSGAFYDFEVSSDQTNWFSANYGGSGYSGDNLYFQLNLRNGVTLPVAQGATVYYRITTGADSQIWWNKTELPGGAGNFRGAVIDFHAYTGDATIIGTIHIADDDGDEYITHTEVTSGSNDSMNNNLWIVTNEGSIRYARLDGEANTLKIHWTAKVFYGNETYD